MNKLKLKTKLSLSLENTAIALSMLIAHEPKNGAQIRKLAEKILRAYEIRRKVK